jgi:alpha-tubulin suppressor-like RCC1 family protein
LKVSAEVKKVSCGWNHSLFSLKGDKGIVMGLGSNEYGQLGLGQINKNKIYL